MIFLAVMTTILRLGKPWGQMCTFYWASTHCIIKSFQVRMMLKKCRKIFWIFNIRHEAKNKFPSLHARLSGLLQNGRPPSPAILVAVLTYLTPTLTSRNDTSCINMRKLLPYEFRCPPFRKQNVTEKRARVVLISLSCTSWQNLVS